MIDLATAVDRTCSPWQYATAESGTSADTDDAERHDSGDSDPAEPDPAEGEVDAEPRDGGPVAPQEPGGVDDIADAVQVLGGGEPQIEVCVNLVDDMRTRVGRCLGDVPMLEVVAGRARLLVTPSVGHVQDVTAEHVAQVDQIVRAATELRDELHGIVANR